MSGFSAVGYFLVSLVFSLIIFLLWARIALRFLRISSFHPISQIIYSYSNPVIIWIAHWLPNKLSQSPQYDWISMALLVCVELLKFLIIGSLFYQTILPLSGLVVYTIADLIVQPSNLLFYAILIRVVMSWINPNWYHPLADILYQLTEPLLRIARQLLPTYGGLDFSPFLIMLLLKIVSIFITTSLPLAIG